MLNIRLLTASLLQSKYGLNCFYPVHQKLKRMKTKDEQDKSNSNYCHFCSEKGYIVSTENLAF